RTAMRGACLLLLGWRIGLPGLVFLSPQDLVGALDVSMGNPATPVVPLWEERSLPAGRVASMIFGALADQWAQGDSFVKQISRLMHIRHAVGLAEGRLTRIVTGPPGCMAVWSALPHGGYWGFFANFSRKPQIMDCAVPQVDAPIARDALSGHPLQTDGRSLTVSIGAYEARHVLLGVSKNYGEMMP
ncbi:MAG: hypothetical protein J5861_02045, partial [Desulfovibrio sp.]|nr:hypothetical protein [Desulfovibrio sp.]